MDIYEKKYKEAIERAKRMFSEKELNYLFPELKESEDERIRNLIINHLTQERGSLSNDEVATALAWLEKQGEQKPILDFKAKDWYVSKVDGKIHNIYYSVDKVEPKFKVGDWVVQGDNILKIKCVGDTYYCFETVSGYVDDMLVSEIDSQFHLWTIQDAKDGDVLVTTFDEDNMIVMYHSMCTKDTINVHCCLDNKFVCWNLGVFDAEDVKPATKEQRDILFEEMQKKGYEWDAEKKELKKIHVIDEGKAEMDYCFTKMMNGEKVSSAWSEEDEKFFKTALWHISYSISNGESTDIHCDTTEWLKSLKNRYTWKPSDEQMKAIHDLNLTGNISYAGQAQTLIELYNDLLKLKG